MKVILLEAVKNLGKFGEIVKVKPGYGRNFLIPQGKGKFATAANIAEFELERAELEKEAARVLAAAQQRAEKINNITITISAMASEEGKLFGSIGIAEIKDGLAKQSIDVTKREIILSDLIHSIGDYVVEIQVHDEIIVPVNLKVVSAK